MGGKLHLQKSWSLSAKDFFFFNFKDFDPAFLFLVKAQGGKIEVGANGDNKIKNTPLSALLTLENTNYHEKIKPFSNTSTYRQYCLEQKNK